GVHVPFPDAGIELEAPAQLPDPPRQRQGDRRGEDDGEQVLLHAVPSAGPSSNSSRSPRMLARRRRDTAPSRRMRTRASEPSAPARTREVASMIVEATPVSLIPSSRYTETLSPSITSASCAEMAAALPVRFALETAS